MINKKILGLECAILIGILITLGLVSAFGIGIAYNVDNPLEINPGQSVDVPIRLQGAVSDGNITLVAKIENGSEIAKIMDSSNNYIVDSSKVIGAMVNLRVSVPENAPIGTEYIVTINYRDATPKQGGTVGLSLSISNTFKVVVTSPIQEPTPTPVSSGMSTTTIILLIASIIVVIAIIWFLIKKKK